MIPRMRARALAAVAAACLLPLAACDGGSGGPSTSPTPTVQPSPPETSLERQHRLDFEAAEKSYRTFIAEHNRVTVKLGGALEPTPVMRQTASGKFLAFYVALLRRQKEARETYTSGTRIGYVRHGAYAPNQLTLEVCEDGSANRVLDKNGKQTGEGQILLRTVYVRPVGGRWKLWNGDERGEASSCESS